MSDLAVIYKGEDAVIGPISVVYPGTNNSKPDLRGFEVDFRLGSQRSDKTPDLAERFTIPADDVGAQQGAFSIGLTAVQTGQLNPRHYMAEIRIVKNGVVWGRGEGRVEIVT